MSYSTALSLRAVVLTDGWLAERARCARDVVIPYQWEALNDRIPGAERSGCLSNLRIAAGEATGAHHGLYWQDSDLAKWLEAVAYRLATHPDATWEATADEVVRLLARAQQEDGYLNTYFQLAEPGRRWSNLRDAHELYTAGHLIEAGVAYFEATGKRPALDVVCRLADLLERTFGREPGKTRGYCGHPEIELALLRLARVTRQSRYAELAAYFVDERGQSPNFFAAEAVRRAEAKPPIYTHHDGLGYWQAHQPVREQTEPVGHAVRAMYLYAAMADLARERTDAQLAATCRRLWTRLVQEHLYITGGIGADGPGGEKFSGARDLPNDRAYAETCAAIGLMFFARRMLDLELRGEFADVMERALYNNVLAGMSRDGRAFFYVNPLEVQPANARRRYDCRYVQPSRVPWFGCACCPPNIARLLTSLGHYLVSALPDGLALHLYTAGTVATTLNGVAVQLRIRTDYPWEETVAIELAIAAGSAHGTLRFRLPGWCTAPRATLNGVNIDAPVAVELGYLALAREWRDGDRLVLNLPMPVETVRAHPAMAENVGCVALQRGPVVYCFEEVDNGPELAAIALPSDATWNARRDTQLLGDCVVLEGDAWRLSGGDALYATTAFARKRVPARAVPYALWNNRGEGEMRVWMREA